MTEINQEQMDTSNLENQTQVELSENLNQTKSNEINFEEDPKIQEYVSLKIKEHKEAEEALKLQLEEERKIKEALDSLTKEEKAKFEEINKSNTKTINEYQKTINELKNTLLEKEVSEVMIDYNIDKSFRPLLQGNNRAEIEEKAKLLRNNLDALDKATKQENLKNIGIPQVQNTSINNSPRNIVPMKFRDVLKSI